MAVSAVVTKPNDEGGQYILYFHGDHTADLWHHPADGQARRLITRNALGAVRREMVQRGISEEGWTAG